MKSAPRDWRFQRWCEEHEAELQQHPSEFIAVSLTDGLVAAAADQKVFMAQLLERRPDPASRHELYLAHTATLLEPGP
jgi:hypothetical protein